MNKDPRRTEKTPLLVAAGLFRIGYGKKRDRKEDLHRKVWLTASATFL